MRISISKKIMSLSIMQLYEKAQNVDASANVLMEEVNVFKVE